MVFERNDEHPIRPIVLIGAARSGTKFLRSLLAAGAETVAVPYDINYVWRYGNERHPDDALGSELATREIQRYIRATLPRLAVRTRGQSASLLVEKTVGNSLRVDFVRKVLPEARFIHIVRDGRDVVESARRM